MGAYAPAFEGMTDVLRTLKKVIKQVEAPEEGSEEPAASVKLSVNMNVSAYSEKIEGDGDDEETAFQYELSKWAAPDAVKILKSSGEMVDDYFEWLQQFPLVSIEDGFEKKDSGSLIALKEKVEGEVTRLAEAAEAGEEEPSPFR
jgi:enolase